jgi:hypothetical protein
MCGIIFNRHKWVYSGENNWHRECSKCHRKEQEIAGIGFVGWVEER